MTYIPVAVEMWSVHEEFSRNPLQTMRDIKKMGYEGVEFAGFPEFAPEFYAGLLKDTGLVCCGWHTPWEALQDDRLHATVALNQAVGNKYLIVPGMAGKTHDDWKKNALDMNGVADKLAPFGMRTGYHCHDVDFKTLDGKTTWTTFMENASSRLVMQLDTGNAMAGGADIMHELNLYPGRCKTIHLKPYSKALGYRPLIGEDECPWRDIIQFCRDKGDTEWAIIEYECPELPSLEAIEKCLKALRTYL